MSFRSTKIVATLGPATDRPGVLKNILQAGVDCARLNCSHGTSEDLIRRTAELRETAAQLDRPVATLFDLQGAKIRFSADVQSRELKPGEQITLTDPEHRRGFPDAQVVAFPRFTELASADSEIVIGDGVPRLRVAENHNGEIIADVTAPGKIGPNKGVNVTFAQGDVPVLTDKDLADLRLACDLQAEFVALSFVRSADDVRELRQRVLELGGSCRIIAKIEKIEAFQDLDAIIAASDGIMVARGDYGVEAGIEWVPAMQKETIRRATNAGKIVICATQMMESMIRSPKPTRAEAMDVHNAVLDGTSAVMLSAETGVGAFPVEAVTEMSRIAQIAELSAGIFSATYEQDAESPDAAVMHAAVGLGRDVNAAALVIPTTSGGTVRACVKHRPRRPVIALCHDDRVARQLTLEWGTLPTFMPPCDSVDQMISVALRRAQTTGVVRSGDQVIVTAGPRIGEAGTTNLIVLRTVPDSDEP
jgi:pyruvate kinase